MWLLAQWWVSMPAAGRTLHDGSLLQSIPLHIGLIPIVVRGYRFRRLLILFAVTPQLAQSRLALNC